MTKRHVPLIATVAIAAVTVLSGCTSAVDGTPTSTTGMVPASTLSSAGTPSAVTSAPTATPTADHVMKTVVSDAVSYWKSTRGVVMTPRVISSTTPDRNACGAPGKADVAWACPDAQLIIYREAPIQRWIDQGDTDAAAIIAAHETTHLALPKVDSRLDSDNFTEEKLAQCGSGAYMRWVVDGNSTKFETDFPSVQAGLDAAYPPDAPIGSLTTDEVEELRSSFKAGYANAEPCLAGVS